MFKWFHKIILIKKLEKQKLEQKTKEIKNYLKFINVINLLIEKIKNLNISFTTIMIDMKDIDFVLIKNNLEINNEEQQYYFETKQKAIIFLKNIKKNHEEKIEKLNKKLQTITDELGEIEKSSLTNSITSTITLKQR